MEFNEAAGNSSRVSALKEGDPQFAEEFVRGKGAGVCLHVSVTREIMEIGARWSRGQGRWEEKGDPGAPTRWGKGWEPGAWGEQGGMW